MAGKFRFDPCGSCCPPGNNCQACQIETAPAQMQVTLPALAEGSCGSCASFAGTYILDYQGNKENGCYKYVFSPTRCGYEDLQAYVRLYSGHYYLCVELILIGHYNSISWWKDLGTSSPDCRYFDGEIVPIHANAGQCVGTGTNCIVTSISA